MSTSGVISGAETTELVWRQHDLLGSLAKSNAFVKR